MRVTVTNAAARQIRERGGSLYMWLGDPGWRSAWNTIEIGTSAPKAGTTPDFEVINLERVTVYVDRAIPLVEDLHIRLWPVTRRLWVRGLPRLDVAGGS